MVGIHELPPEVIIKILVEAGRPGNLYGYPEYPMNSQDLYSIATSSKQLYAIFKENEYQIFLQLAKQIVANKWDTVAKECLSIKLAATFASATECHSFLFSDWYLKRVWETKEELVRIMNAKLQDLVQPSKYSLTLKLVRMQSFHARIHNVIHFKRQNRRIGNKARLGCFICCPSDWEAWWANCKACLTDTSLVSTTTDLQ
jgi:Rad3-related DNA helicase